MRSIAGEYQRYQLRIKLALFPCLLNFAKIKKGIKSQIQKTAAYPLTEGKRFSGDSG